MNSILNKTRIKIANPTHDVFEAFADPEKNREFWFPSSSERWKSDRNVVLHYDEYDAEGKIDIIEIQNDWTIIFRDESGHLVILALPEESPSSSIIEVMENGFDETSPEFAAELIDNKEGWVYTLACLKAYLKYGVNLRAAPVK